MKSFLKKQKQEVIVELNENELEQNIENIENKVIKPKHQNKFENSDLDIVQQNGKINIQATNVFQNQKDEQNPSTLRKSISKQLIDLGQGDQSQQTQSDNQSNSSPNNKMKFTPKNNDNINKIILALIKTTTLYEYQSNYGESKRTQNNLLKRHRKIMSLDINSLRQRRAEEENQQKIKEEEDKNKKIQIQNNLKDKQKMESQKNIIVSQHKISPFFEQMLNLQQEKMLLSLAHKQNISNMNSPHQKSMQISSLQTQTNQLQSLITSPNRSNNLYNIKQRRIMRTQQSDNIYLNYFNRVESEKKQMLLEQVRKIKQEVITKTQRNLSPKKEDSKKNVQNIKTEQAENIQKQKVSNIPFQNYDSQLKISQLQINLIPSYEIIDEIIEKIQINENNEINKKVQQQNFMFSVPSIHIISDQDSSEKPEQINNDNDNNQQKLEIFESKQKENKKKFKLISNKVITNTNSHKQLIQENISQNQQNKKDVLMQTMFLLKQKKTLKELYDGYSGFHIDQKVHDLLANDKLIVDLYQDQLEQFLINFQQIFFQILKEKFQNSSIDSIQKIEAQGIRSSLEGIFLEADLEIKKRPSFQYMNFNPDKQLIKKDVLIEIQQHFVNILQDLNVIRPEIQNFVYYYNKVVNQQFTIVVPFRDQFNRNVLELILKSYEETQNLSDFNIKQILGDKHVLNLFNLFLNEEFDLEQIVKLLEFKLNHNITLTEFGMLKFSTWKLFQNEPQKPVDITFELLCRAEKLRAYFFPEHHLYDIVSLKNIQLALKQSNFFKTISTEISEELMGFSLNLVQSLMLQNDQTGFIQQNQQILNKLDPAEKNMFFQNLKHTLIANIPSRIDNPHLMSNQISIKIMKFCQQLNIFPYIWENVYQAKQCIQSIKLEMQSRKDDNMNDENLNHVTQYILQQIMIYPMDSYSVYDINSLFKFYNFKEYQIQTVVKIFRKIYASLNSKSYESDRVGQVFQYIRSCFLQI